MRPPNGVTFSSGPPKKEDTKHWNVDSPTNLSFRDQQNSGLSWALQFSSIPTTDKDYSNCCIYISIHHLTWSCLLPPQPYEPVMVQSWASCLCPSQSCVSFISFIQCCGQAQPWDPESWLCSPLIALQLDSLFNLWDCLSTSKQPFAYSSSKDSLYLLSYSTVSLAFCNHFVTYYKI